MSDTDKTKPVWVKLRQNPQWRRERHNHNRGPCSLTEVDENLKHGFRFYYTRGDCYFWVAKGINRIIWERPSKAEQAKRDEYNGSERRRVRHLRQDIIKMSREDVEDYDFGCYQHRRSALWDVD